MLKPNKEMCIVDKKTFFFKCLHYKRLSVVCNCWWWCEIFWLIENRSRWGFLWECHWPCLSYRIEHIFVISLAACIKQTSPILQTTSSLLWLLYNKLLSTCWLLMWLKKFTWCFKQSVMAEKRNQRLLGMGWVPVTVRACILMYVNIPRQAPA